MVVYRGPLRREPVAVELHNTLYAIRGELVDGLETADDLSAWLSAIADRLPVRARGADLTRHGEFVALRGAVRDALQAMLAREPVSETALEMLNGVAARAPVSPLAVPSPGGRLRAETRYHTADATDIALATLAGDALSLLTDPVRGQLRACGAPGCVLVFQTDHPRRRWCSGGCGNRVRQARHYVRAREARR